MDYQITADDRERAVCSNCGHVHFENPLPIVGMIAYTADGRVLLGRRGIEPKKGFWSLPAGFMELGEATHAGAQRELLEETGVSVQGSELFAVLNVPGNRQVHLFYTGLIDNESAIRVCDEMPEIQLFSEIEVDFENLAFDTNRTLLKRFFQEFKKLGKVKSLGPFQFPVFAIDV